MMMLYYKDMAATLPVEIFRLLEDNLGKDEAVKVSRAVELCLETIENKAKDTALQKKLELKDELTKELATKADLQLAETRLNGRIDMVKAEIKAEIQQVEARINIKFIIILVVIILNNPKALDLIARIFGIVK